MCSIDNLEDAVAQGGKDGQFESENKILTEDDCLADIDNVDEEADNALGSMHCIDDKNNINQAHAEE